MATANSGLYPITVKLRDGREATIRIMEPSDRDAILKFAAKLPADDLLFLRTDITDKEVIKGWVDNIKSGNTITLLAEIDGELIAYASVHVDSARWTRRIGEIRVLASPRARGLGLGRRLTNEADRPDDARSDLGALRVRAPGLPGRGDFDRLGGGPRRSSARSADHDARRDRFLRSHPRLTLSRTGIRAYVSATRALALIAGKPGYRPRDRRLP
jgi:GNAT superfamily N-acetyltransferase